MQMQEYLVLLPFLPTQSLMAVRRALSRLAATSHQQLADDDQDHQPDQLYPGLHQTDPVDPHHRNLVRAANRDRGVGIGVEDLLDEIHRDGQPDADKVGDAAAFDHQERGGQKSQAHEGDVRETRA